MKILESECPVCSGKETWTGVTELRDGQTYFEMHCADCGSTGFEWSKDWAVESIEEKL